MSARTPTSADALRAIRRLHHLLDRHGDMQGLIRDSCETLAGGLGYPGVRIALLGDTAPPVVAVAGTGAGGLGAPTDAGAEVGGLPPCLAWSIADGATVSTLPPSLECETCWVPGGAPREAVECRRVMLGGSGTAILSVALPQGAGGAPDEESLLGGLADVLAFVVRAAGTLERGPWLDELLLRSGESFTLAFRAIPDAMLLTTASDGRIVEVNQGFTAMSGFAEGEAVGRTTADLGLWMDPSDRETYVGRVLRDGSVRDLEIRLRKRDGSPLRGLVSGTTIPTREGELVLSIVRDVTEQRRAEEALRESERRLRSYLEHAPHGVFLCDREGRYLDVNAAAARMTGYSEERLRTMTVEDVAWPVDGGVGREHFERLLSTGASTGEVAYRHASGEKRWWSLSAVRLDDDRCLGFAEDVTERRQRVERISLLGMMLDQAPAAITIHTTDGRFIYANRQAVRLHGYDDESEYLALNLHELDAPESEARIAERMRSIAETGEARFEAVHFRRDGTTFPLEVLATQIDWHDEPAILSIAADISGRREAEEALSVALEKYRVLFEAFPLGISVTDEQGRIVEVNRESERLLGVAVGEHLERTIADPGWRIVRPDGSAMPPEEYASVRALRERRAVGNVEMGIVRPDGATTWINVTAAPIPLPGYGVAITYGDVSSRRQAEEERENLREQLQQAQKMESIGRLAGGVAHDFNNMLGVILARAELMLLQMPMDATCREGLEEIRTAALRSADLTRQLLAFARKQTIAPRVLDLNATVGSTLAMLRRLIGEDLELEWRPGAELWPVMMDPAQVDQVLANLCVNARDAIEGPGQVTIETANVVIDQGSCGLGEGLRPGSYVQLTVSDTGCGMSRDVLGRVFEPFFTTKEMGRGTGLGLATVYGIARQNAGAVRAYSEPGQGSTFKIYIPAEVGGVVSPVVETRATVPSARGETILLVEDDPAIREAVTGMLEQLGYAVLSAPEPDQALEAARRYPGRIHLLITDVVMPRMSGRELATEVAAARPGTPVLFMSGYTENVVAHRGVLDEDVSFLQKPFSLQQLGATLRELLDPAS